MEKKDKKELEKCAVCHRDTQYFKDTDIKERKNYIIGAGQLCYECYHELYVQPEMARYLDLN
jgi:hypothetical protein